MAQFLTMGLAFITMPIFTRLMSPEEYGIMSVFTSFEGIIAIIFGLGIRGAISRYYYEDKNDFFSYLSSNIWLIIIASFGLTFLALLFKGQLQSFLNIPFGMIYLAIGIAIPQAIFQLYESYLQASKRSKKVALLNMIRAVLATGLAIIIILKLEDEKYYAKAIGQGIAALALFLMTIFYLKKRLVFSIKKEHLGYSLVFGLPIILHLLSQNILNSFDQIIINQIVGQRETGIYSVAYKIGMIQSLVSMGILKAWTPMFYEKLNKNKYNDINALAKKYAFIVMLVAVFLILFAQEIIALLADNSYHEAISIIPIVVISYFFFFLYTMYVNYAFYEKKTKNIAVITIIAGGLNILLNYLLIPGYGYIAAAWTTLISYVALFLFHYINIKWILKVKRIINIKIFVIPTFMLIFTGLMSFIVLVNTNNYISSLAVRILTFGLTAAMTYVFFKRKNNIRIY